MKSWIMLKEESNRLMQVGSFFDDLVMVDGGG